MAFTLLLSLYVSLQFIKDAGLFAMITISLLEVRECISYYSVSFIQFQNCLINVKRCFRLCDL
jgi:hypothetical protein